MNSNEHALLLVGSAKPAGSSTSEVLGDYLLDRLSLEGITGDKILLHRALRTATRMDQMLDAVGASDLLILAFPLYVDCLPHLVTQALERIAAHRARAATVHPVRFLAIANCGFPEASHNETALAICRTFAQQTNMAWAGGLALGGGGAIGGGPLAEAGGRAGTVITALDHVAAALARGEPAPAEAIELMARPLIPPRLYTTLATIGWHTQSWQNGVHRHLGDRPFMDPIT